MTLLLDCDVTLMRSVYLIDIGQTAVSKNGRGRGRYLVADAIEPAMYHAGTDAADIGRLVVGDMMSGILTQQQQLGALCADVAGLRGIENIGGIGATVVSHILKREA